MLFVNRFDKFSKVDFLLQTPRFHFNSFNSKTPGLLSTSEELIIGSNYDKWILKGKFAKICGKLGYRIASSLGCSSIEARGLLASATPTWHLIGPALPDYDLLRCLPGGVVFYSASAPVLQPFCTCSACSAWFCVFSCRILPFLLGLNIPCGGFTPWFFLLIGP